MKIISKYKDFYDYLVQDYDSDVTYFREARGRNHIENPIPDELFLRGWDEVGDRLIHLPNSNYTKKQTFNDDHIFLCLGNIFFGIYPFIYAAPIFYLNENKIEFISRNLFDIIKKSGNNREKIIIDYFKDKKYNIISIDNLKYLYNSAEKFECPEFFNNLDSPVFLENPRVIGFGTECYSKIAEDDYLLDISLREINPGLIKFWYDDLMNINTYNNIENFLISKKQEPISEPSNSQKIVNHGFDLKTSFRKM